MPERIQSMSYQLFMMVLCIYTLFALAIEVVVRPQGEAQTLLNYADTAICVLFLGDFVISLVTAPNRWRYFYTWGWLDLLSSIPTLDAARWGRAARIARVFRVLRGIRATRIVGSLLLEQRGRSSMLAAALVTMLLLFVASISVLQVETAADSNIKTADDAVWWALTTMTTVGYGDRFPVTPEGRIVAGMLMVSGVALFGMFSGFLAAWFVGPSQDESNELALLRREIAEIKGMLAHASRREDQPAP
jgi:voltage-gated potassium channel